MVRKEKVNENLSIRYEMEHTNQGNIDTTRRLIGVSLPESRHIILDKDVLKIREGIEKKKTTRILTKANGKYNTLMSAYTELNISPTEETYYKGKH